MVPVCVAEVQVKLVTIGGDVTVIDVVAFAVVVVQTPVELATYVMV